MTDAEMPMDGECRCGNVRFRVTAPPLMSAACHCTGCQRMTGSAFSLTVFVPTDGFALVAGAPVIGGLHDDEAPGHWPKHWHCAACKSWVYTTLPPAMGFVNVRTTMLDDPAAFPPFIDTWISEQLPWAITPAAHRFDRFPAMEEFPTLIAAYAASRTDRRA